MWRRMAWIVAWAATACSAPNGDGADPVTIGVDASDAESVDGASDGRVMTPDVESVDAATPDATPPPPRCETEGPPWHPGQPVFENATERWGLVGVEGEYLSVTDVDGDGRPDLVSRKGGGTDDFTRGGVRHKWVLRNTGPGGFEDWTKQSRLFRSRLEPNPSHGRAVKVVASGDVDNDGDLDFFLGQPRTDPQADSIRSDVVLNRGDGVFEWGPEASDARFEARPSNPAGATFVDFDRDGLLDLWIVHNEQPGLVPMQDALLKGDGAGGFTDVTHSVGLTTVPWNDVAALNAAEAHSWGWGAVACDLDHDGLPELMASAYGRTPNHLWHPVSSNDEVTFENASIESGFAWDHRVDWRDNLNAQCYCADRPIADECDTCPEPADPQICDSLRRAFGENYRWSHANGRQRFNLGGVTGTTVCVDIDNDGHLDLMNYEIVHADTGSSSDPTEPLFNTGERPLRFERPGPEALGLTRPESNWYWDHGDMTGAVFDFDNDGWSDIYIGAAEYGGNRGLLYRQTAARRFELLTVDESFLHFRAHGVAVADFDRDGDLDLVLGHSRFRCEGFEGTECAPTNQIQVFENIVGQNRSWLQLRLEGADGTNRAAIGARVTVEAAGVRQTQVVDGGHGRQGLQRDPMLHFGLGDACEASVSITWPDRARTQTQFTSAPNQRWHVIQGVEPAPLVMAP